MTFPASRASVAVPRRSLQLPLWICLATAWSAQRSATAQTPALLRDVNTIPTVQASSNPSRFVAQGSRVFCAAAGAGTGQELWRLDVLGNSASLVADIQSGPVGSDPASLTLFAGALYFVADDGASGRELWRSDGTAAGTQLLLDIAPGAASAEPQELTVVGNELYFTAASPLGRELWLTDGTSAGTRLVADLVPGSGGASPQQLTAFGGALFFRANLPASGAELWRSDGTAAGTTLVQDLVPGSASSTPEHLRVVGSRLLFGAAGGLWRTDGTAPGTLQIGAVPPVAMQSTGTLAYYLGSASGQDVYVTDGTSSGTRLLGTVGYGAGTRATHLAVVGQRAVALVVAGPTQAWLWGCDSTSIAQLPVLCDTSAESMARLGPNLLFRPQSNQYEQLWQTDGTPGGTFPVVHSFYLLSGPTDLAEVPAAGGVVFSAVDGYGREPWFTNGTFGGTRRIADVAVPATGATQSSAPMDFVDAGGVGYFAATTGTRTTLWRTDGTTAGTRPVVANVAAQPNYSGELRAVGTRVFFLASGTVGTEIWVSDGSAVGTHRLQDPLHGPIGSNPSDLTVAGDRLYFVANAPQAALWCTDGTSQGTVRVTDPTTSGIQIAGAFGRGLVFSAFTTTFGHEPHFTNGTAASTVRLGDLTPGSGSSDLSTIAVIGQRAYFFSVATLFRTDGTPAGTQPFLPNLFPTMPPYAVGGRFYFALPDLVTFGSALWVTDGTVNGTQFVFSHLPSAMRPLGSIGDLFLYVATSGGRNALWRTDGTPAGTVPLGPLDVTEQLGTDDRYAWFAAEDAAGVELWRTDGTAAGTARYADLWPGPTSSQPRALALSSGRLLFSAAHPQAGREPWVLQLGATVQDIGYACPAASPSPRLAATSPVLGTTSTVSVHGGPQQGLGIVLLSFGTTGSFRLPGGRCDLFLDPALVVLGIAPLVGGTCSLPLGLPADPGFAGVALRTQALLLPQAAQASIEATQALALTLGL